MSQPDNPGGVPRPQADALRTAPVSRLFGLDLGTSLCRYYLKRFLAGQAGHIRGRVLEVGDNAYTLAYGAGVTASDVLNAVPAPNATVVGDLATGAGLPRAAFDCILLTQTIQCIYDFKAALKNAYQCLRPGGSMLLSASGISQISRYDMDRWGEFWRFTDLSLRRSLEEACPGAAIQVTAWGNVAAAKGYLDGLPAESFPAEVLDVCDPDYQMVLTALVQRPATDAALLAPSEAPDGWTDLALPDDLAGVRAFAEQNRHGRWRLRFRGLTIHCLDLLAFHTAAKDIFLQGIYDFPSQVAHPVVIDGGAHIGLFTLRVKALHPGARVLAFEPDPGARELLRLNCAANGLDGVEIIPAGLFDRAGQPTPAAPGSAGTLGASPDTLDARPWPWQEQTIDLLRLNLAEAELPLLLESGESLRLVRCLALEHHGEPDMGGLLHRLLGLLHGRGFRYALRGLDPDAACPLLVWGRRAHGLPDAPPDAPNDTLPDGPPDALPATSPGGPAPAGQTGRARRDPALARELAVVVRGVGEATTGTCLELLRRALPDENIVLLREIPFSRAVVCTYERGLAARRPWVLALDADMLLRPGALARLLAQAQAQPEDVFALWALSLDKALRVLRPVGLHLYRGGLLEQALKLAGSGGFEQSLRPETAMVNRMLASGFSAVQTDVFVGLHDYGQSPRSLLKKGFLHARKHAQFMDILRPQWERLGLADADYRALAAGAALGARHQGQVRVDDAQLSELTAALLAELALPEPPPLAPEDAQALVQAELEAHGRDPERQAMQDAIFPERYWRRVDREGC